MGVVVPGEKKKDAIYIGLRNAACCHTTA